MILFSNQELQAINPATDQPYLRKPKTMASTTRSMTVSNLSKYALQVKSDTTNQYGILPAFSSKTYAVQPAQVITFEVIANNFDAGNVNNQYVELTESQIIAESGVTPLALIPVYVSNVNVANTAQVALSGDNTVNIGNSPTVSLTAGSTVNIGNTVTANIAAGTIDATIQNAQIDTNLTNAIVQTGVMAEGTPYTANITNMANGTSLLFQLTIPESMYDQFILRVGSTLDLGINITAKYKFSLQYLKLTQYGLQTGGTLQDLINWGPTNNLIGSTKPYYISNDGLPVIGNQIAISVINISGVTIAADSLTLQAYMKYATSQVLYSQKEGSLRSFSIASEVVAANGGTGAIQYTPSILISNSKRLNLLIQSNGSGYVSGSAGVRFQIQVSNDNTNWYNVGGNSTYPNTLAINVSGAENGAYDSAITPQMVQGYKYIRLKIFHYNGTAGSLTMANSSIVINTIYQV